MARLKDYYKADVAPALMKKFSYKSVMQIPKLDKIVINVGAGEAKENAKAIDAIMADLMKHHRPASDGLQGEEVRRELQASRRHEHRREGYSSRRQNVRVHGSPL